MLSNNEEKRIMQEMYDYETFENYVESAGWEDWMNDFTDSADGEECSESELIEITNIQRYLWSRK